MSTLQRAAPVISSNREVNVGTTTTSNFNSDESMDVAKTNDNERKINEYFDIDMQGDLDHPGPRKFEDKSQFNTATGTSQGLINPDYRDMNEEWLIYEELTETAFLHSKENAMKPRQLRNLAKSADGIRRQAPRLTKNKRTVLDNVSHKKGCGEIIFDGRADGDKTRDVASPPMRNSLFPHVPPYVLFHSHDYGTSEKLPKDFSQLLRWKLSAGMPRILMKILLKTGYRMVTKGNDWSAAWYPCCGDISKYQRLKSFQKVNSIPGSHHLGNKDLLWIHLRTMMRKFGYKEYNFMPKTFVLPKEMHKFEGAWQKLAGCSTWIIKPPTSGRGQGIKVINQWWEIPKWHSVIVQRYISKPRLINGSKFDLRVYVLVTSVNPLRCYVYKEGLVRFASARYIRGTNLNNKYMHLTNTSVNKQNSAYVISDGVKSFRGHKWSLESLWSHLKQQGVNSTEIWSHIKDIVVKTLIAAESTMSAAISENLTSHYTYYELYGFDVLLDETFKPWLLEVNSVPSLQTDSPLDTTIKGALVKNMLNMVGYQIPRNELTSGNGMRNRKYDTIAHDCRLYSTALNTREKLKQIEINKIQNRAEYLDRILENLTRDDLRQLVRYEDELTQIGDFEKTFPTKQSHSYLKFFDVKRYYDRLLDAWEHRYSDNREKGIDMLKNCCQNMQHLEPNPT